MNGKRRACCQLFFLWAAAAVLVADADAGGVVFAASDFSSLWMSISKSNNRSGHLPVPVIQLSGSISVVKQLPPITQPVVLVGLPSLSDGTPGGLVCDQSADQAEAFGALRVLSGGVVLQDITFAGCQSTALVIDAAGSDEGGASVLLSRCLFEDNAGRLAGAVEVQCVSRRGFC